MDKPLTKKSHKGMKIELINRSMREDSGVYEINIVPEKNFTHRDKKFVKREDLYKEKLVKNLTQGGFVVDEKSTGEKTILSITDPTCWDKDFTPKNSEKKMQEVFETAHRKATLDKGSPQGLAT